MTEALPPTTPAPVSPTPAMKPTPAKRKPLTVDVDGAVRKGMWLVAVGFIGFLTWSALAPLSSAVVAPGVVVADSRNKTIQHLEGGIIDQIMVREGDTVAAGQIVARLKSVSTTSGLGRLTALRMVTLAEAARLDAERDGLSEIKFPEELLRQSNDPEVAQALKGQQVLFQSRRESAESERAILSQRIQQYEAEIQGIEAQIASGSRQLGLIRQELTTVREMVAKGYERKPRLLALQRSAEELSGQRSAQESQVTRARQSIGEMEERLSNLKSERLDSVMTDLRQVQARVSDVNEQIKAAADAAQRLDVEAPTSGKVVSIFLGSAGGVVRPGETIMELLPDQDTLLVEVEVRPEDVDDIAPGATARVRLTGMSQRWTDSLTGQVTHVSADRIVDPNGRRGHFMARVAVDLNSGLSIRELKLYPGMPAAVFIETGKQSLLAYLVMPLFGSVERAFRER